MKIGLITTWEERCGIATYGEELVSHVMQQAPDIQFIPIARPFTHQGILDRCADVDIVHLNHVWSLFGAITPLTVNMLRNSGKKTVCTFHESTTYNRNPLTEVFDRVVVHQKSSDGFVHIPHGIPDPDIRILPIGRPSFVGTAGFPIGFKNNALIARVANHFGLKVHAFVPESAHADAQRVADDMRHACPDSIIDLSYRTHEEIVTTLKSCLFTIFLHDQAGGGVSGSVRLGIAANRPVVITRASRFHDLYEDYADEFYIVESASPTFDDVFPVVQQLLNDMKRIPKWPMRVIDDMNWTKCAEKYIEVYRSLF